MIMPRRIKGAIKSSALLLFGIFLSVANVSGTSAGARESLASQRPAVEIAETAGKACDSAKSVTPKPYRGVFYENDFSFLDDPCYQAEKHGDAFSRATDSLKRVNLAPGLVADFGGEYRARFHVERNHGSTKLANLDNDFLLQRVRLYANFEAGDFFRLYAEGIDASIQFEDLTARTIELNRFDILNLFVDGKVSAGLHKFVARIGRQELLFGGQRLISPLDWGNTRRTFDGVRLIGDSPDWSVSLFGAHPVLAGQRAGRGPGQEFDEGESSQLFLGGLRHVQGHQTAPFRRLSVAADRKRRHAGRDPLLDRGRPVERRVARFHGGNRGRRAVGTRERAGPVFGDVHGWNRL